MPREILFLCHRLPYPPNKGDKIRSHALFTHLASRGRVHLGCFIDDANDLEYVDTVRQLAKGDCHFELIGPVTKAIRGLTALASGEAVTIASFRSSAMNRYLIRQFRQRRFDDVVVFGSAVAPYLFRPDFEPKRVLFDMVDVDSDKWQQYSGASNGFFKWLYRREAKTLATTERTAAQLFGKTLLVSEFEAETFRRMAPQALERIGALTNGVDLAYFALGQFESPFSLDETPVVMTGQMDYRPNYEGALWFINHVLPLVREKIPNARVHFVGASPPAVLRALASSSVTVTGRVADVRPYLQFAAAVVAPLLIARGVQNKVLEAMAMAKPVVATREAARALGVQSGTHLWVANDPHQFADAVVRAVVNPEACKVAAAGHDYVVRSHSWPNVLSDFDQELDRLQAACHTASGPGSSALSAAVL